MNIEIINTSSIPVTDDLEEALRVYAPYHEFGVQTNRITVDTEIYSYDVRCIVLKVDEAHITIWISDWYRRYLNE